MRGERGVEADTAADEVLRGTVLYRERMALQPDATIEVRLEDVSIADRPRFSPRLPPAAASSSLHRNKTRKVGSPMVASSSRFTIEGALKEGWRAFTANVVPMALYALLVLVIGFVLDLVLGDDDAGAIRTAFANLVLFVVNQLITIGWLRLALDIVDGRGVSADRVRESFGILVPFAIAAILFSIMVAVGMVLLIVPGIIAIVVFGFYGWVLVDGATKEPVEALRRSAEITRGERLHLFGFGVVLFVLNLVGLMVFVIGVLVTSAVSILAVAHVYRRLQGVGPETVSDVADRSML